MTKSTSSKAKKTDSKKVAAKATTKKSASKETLAATRPKPVVTRSQAKTSVTAEGQIALLRKLAVVVYGGLAVAAAMLMNGTGQQLRWFYQTRDALASQQGTAYAMGSKLVAELPYRIALIVVLVLAATFSLLALTKYKQRYQAALANKLVPYRWVCVAITGALMIEIVAMLHGVQDIAVLKVMAGSIVATALLAWVAERDNTVRQPSWRVFAISVLTGALPWLIIAAICSGTLLYGGVRLPWHAYAAAGITFVGFAAIALNQFLGFKQYNQWKDYLTVERNYLLAGLLMKTAFAVVLILGFQR